MGRDSLEQLLGMSARVIENNEQHTRTRLQSIDI